MVDRTGQQLGYYVLKSLLGQGGFADVYLGEHVYLKRLAAVKVLQIRMTQNELQEFVQEAQIIAALEHPHIVRVYDFGVADDTSFLVMDYAPQGSLRHKHPRGMVLSPATIVLYVKQVAAALQYAHDQKLIHRDIKPENMLLGKRDDILVSDFGLAVVARSTHSWEAQKIAGTAPYMSPEQFRAKAVPASDQYSLAVAVYEWLTGSLPFDEGNFIELGYQHRYEPVPPLREKNPAITVPPQIEQVVMKGLAKEPGQRFERIEAFANALEQALRPQEPTIGTMVFGIDLGTTSSYISYVDEYGQAAIIPSSNGARVTPSVVLFEGENPIVGEEAKNGAVLNPDRAVTFWLRNMGDDHFILTYNGKDFTPEKISSYILRKLADDAERYLGYPVKDIVITCPIYFDMAMRRATVRACEMAALNVRAIINAPTAAAIMYALQIEHDQVVLVYDLGGGCFDVAVIEIKKGAITVLAADSDHHLGGKDWEDHLISHLATLFAEEFEVEMSDEEMNHLRVQSEMLKRSLSMRQSVDIRVQAAGRVGTYTITRTQFEDLTRYLLERTQTLIELVLREADKTWQELSGVLPVGGSTKMPMITDSIKRMSGKPPMTGINTDEAVALGTAVYGQKLAIDEQIQIKVAKMAGISPKDVDISKVSTAAVAQAQAEVAQSIGLRAETVQKINQQIITNVASLSYGIVVVKEDKGTGTRIEGISNLVFKNHPLPTSRSQYYRTLQADQEWAEIKIMESYVDNEFVDDIFMGIEMGNFGLRLPHHLPAGSPIEVTFKLDHLGQLLVIGREPSSNMIRETYIETYKGHSFRDKESMGSVQIPPFLSAKSVKGQERFLSL